jgi:hypothetical protein
MNNFRFKIIKWLKKVIDKAYYSEYTYNRETLIREMFPWIISIWEYKNLNTFILNNNIENINSIVKIIWDYYWGEVQRYTFEKNFQKIESLQWLLDFSQSIKDYYEYASRLNNNL